MTRDSVWFSWLAVGIAVAGYLALGTDPRDWSFHELMQNVVAVGGILSAKLGSSPLPSSDEAGRVRRGAMRR